MRQVSLIGLLLFVAAFAVPTPDHAAWSAAPACIGARGARSPAHEPGRCVRPQPRLHHQHRAHDERMRHPAPWHAQARSRTIIVSEDVTAGAVVIRQAPPLLLPAATKFVPPPVPGPVRPVSRPAMPAPVLAQPVAMTAPPEPDGSVIASIRAATRSDRFRHKIGPLLLWAFVIASAGLLFRLAVTRRRLRPMGGGQVTPGSDWDSVSPAPEGMPLSWRQLSIAHSRDAYDQPLDESPLAPVDRLTLAAVEAAAERIENRDNPEPPATNTAGLGMSLVEYKRRCVAALRRAGWTARTRFSAGLPGPDVIANSGDVVLTLQCHASTDPVDAGAVKEACTARERQRSNLAAIVANGPFTEAARQLAERTGIALLHEDQLASFAG